MAAGDDDANDATPLRHDPVFTLRLERLPATGPPWAAHPPRARGAHHVSRPALSRMACVLVAPLLASDARPPSASFSPATTPRPLAMARRHRPVTMAMRAALAAGHCPCRRA